MEAKLHCQPLSLAGLMLVTPTVRNDDRGFFLETYHGPKYHAAGIPCNFVQDNHSRSSKGTVRGLHFQKSPGQDKLVRVVRGAVWDVAVDMRPGSPTYGRYEAVTLDAKDHQQLFVPKGFAHGFCVLSDEAEVLYKVSAPYDAAEEAGFAFDDPAVGIAWPLPRDALRLSERDQQAPPLSAYGPELARYAASWAAQ